MQKNYKVMIHNGIINILNGLAVRGKGSHKKLLSRVFMALFSILPAAGMAQTDYSGVYYLNSRGKDGPNVVTVFEYYLCPTEGWCYYVAVDDYTGTDNGQPFITTYKCKVHANDDVNPYDVRKAVWIVEKQGDYYYIKRAIDGKYLVFNGQIRTAGANRCRVHIESMATPDDNALFTLLPKGENIVAFVPKNKSGWVLTVNQGNFDQLVGTDAKTDGPSGYPNTGGIVGIWNNENDVNSPFYLEEAVLQPVISQASNGDITINCATNNTTIYYTLNGSTPVVPDDGDPDPTGPTYKYTTTFAPALGSTGVNAVAVMSNLHAAVSKMAELSFSVYSTPTISFDGLDQVTISAAHADATIYYTIDGNDPVVGSSPTHNGTPFTITINTTTTVKAIATHTGFLTSAVANSGPLEPGSIDAPIVTINCDNSVSLEVAVGAIYYNIGDGTQADPDNNSTLYENPFTPIAGQVIKAITYIAGHYSTVTSEPYNPTHTAVPTIESDEGTVTITGPTTSSFIYFTTDGTDPTTSLTGYSSPHQFTVTSSVTVKAIAQGGGLLPSCVVSRQVSAAHSIHDATDLANIANDMAGEYIIVENINASSFNTISGTFTGILEAAIDPATNMPYRISGLGAPLFTTLTGTVKNLVLEDVSISAHEGNTGAIACAANDAARIYNVGILSGSVGGTGYTGGLVGLLDHNGTDDGARVINCFSYATITGGSHVGGIVGYNNYASTASDIRTMVMNCMFYGDITGGINKSPVFGGNNIANLQGGLNTFNYYAYDQLPTSHITSDKYNSTLAVEEKYLNRFEFYRLLLNSNKKLAAFYITGDANDANLLAKWVLETADRTNDNPYPYPILKAQGTYPSIINPDIANAPDSTVVGPNKGGKLGKTLSVTISGVGSNAPTGASITTNSLTLQRTDKDFDRFNFNYDKVQLPYYNDVGEGNYTGNRVVTGWKITAITTVANDPYTAANYDYTKTYSSTPTYFDYPNYNFADRKSSNKDLYSVSGRVFSQGAYFDVPYGVTSITIEPYWAKACYIADPNYDVVYDNDYENKQNVTQTGTQVDLNTTQFNGQSVETSITRILDYIANNLGGLGSTVYDNAIVLVGNLHLNTVPLNGNRPFTMMSVDTDNDHEPDYSLIYHHKSRSNITPIRFDFLAVPGTAQAQKPNGASLVCNFTIFKTRGWFEVTNTAFMYSNQLEYENGELGNGVTKIDAPLILLGGIFDQFVSTQRSDVYGRTIYIHLGGNLWIDQFGMGTHSDGSKSTPHVPVSVTGGDYVGFYLTGTYNQNADIKDDNAECYISGGRFAEIAGACQEQIGVDPTDKGNVHWQIYNADITDFFGGGINDAGPVMGNITTDIFNSRAGTFCGGPKFGNMASGKMVTTNAEGCVFDNYFGAGYGGNSISRKKYYDNINPNFTNLQKYYYCPTDPGNHQNERGKYYNGSSSSCPTASYGKKGPGVATDFDYEFFVWSSGSVGARFFIKFVSFSLAQCNNVSSTLTGCTINDSFYGGGSLGKVTGDVTSILDNCTVKGNVFGAGFSATLPTIEVRNAGFTTNPKFNSTSGMFEPGVFSGTTTFTWQHKDSYPSEGDPGFLTDDGTYSIPNGTSVVTKVDITPSNLGSVAGTVSLTLKGNTVVGTEGVSTTGNVFGGGAMSAADDDVTVTLQGETKVLSNVFGGGDQGVVRGNTTVKLQEGAQVLGNVYGGGNNGAVDGSSSVTIQDD